MIGVVSGTLGCPVCPALGGGIGSTKAPVQDESGGKCDAVQRGEVEGLEELGHLVRPAYLVAGCVACVRASITMFADKRMRNLGGGRGGWSGWECWVRRKWRSGVGTRGLELELRRPLPTRDY
jgi:hypothetical protein